MLPLTALQADQEPSGAGVLPDRTSKLTVVPAGTLPAEVRSSQSTTSPASNTRDSKTHGELYGDIRSQSTETMGPPTL